MLGASSTVITSGNNLLSLMRVPPLDEERNDHDQIALSHGHRLDGVRRFLCVSQDNARLRRLLAVRIADVLYAVRHRRI